MSLTTVVVSFVVFAVVVIMIAALNPKRGQAKAAARAAAQQVGSATQSDPSPSNPFGLIFMVAAVLAVGARIFAGH